MVVALVEDLMFTSKIRSAAIQLGVPVTFVRSVDTALAFMRAAPPALVIMDLNSRRLDPLGTLAAMKSDASLAGIPIVGYVSHVDAATIDQARSAGLGEVLARSAFAERLGEILRRAAGPATSPSSGADR